MADLLTAEQIEKRRQWRRERVYVEQYEGDVQLQSMSALERDEYEDKYTNEKGDWRAQPGFRAELLSKCIVDQEGQRPYAGDEGVAKINTWDTDAVQTMFEAAMKLCGLGKAEQEERQKNSDGDQPEPSPSGSGKTPETGTSPAS